MPSNVHWPESCGFTISGNGPCYVITVEHGSQAHRAGLIPGDQLLELDGHSVTDMSSEAVKRLAKHSHSVPPTVGVVSRLRPVELVAHRKWGYGLSLANTKPVTIDSVDPPGPAYQAGLRTGDIVLEVNGRHARNVDVIQPLLNSHFGKAVLAVIKTDKLPPKMPGVEDRVRTHQGSRVKKARDLFAKMNQTLGNDFEKKMQAVGVLKQYAEDRDIDQFCSALDILLKSPEHRHLLKEIRPFIPVRHRGQFDRLLKHEPAPSTSTQSHHGTSSTVSHQPSLASRLKNAEKRLIKVHRGSGSFGFILRGHDPVYVESVDPGGAADKAGLQPGDGILKLNGLDVRRCGHSHLVKLLQGSGASPSLEVAQLFEKETVVSPIQSQSSLLSSASSNSSHASTGWLSDGMVLDKDGHSFRQQVDFLMTDKEKAALKRVLVKYDSNHNIGQLLDGVSAIFDTPSKQTLWVFLVPRLHRPDHKDYVLRHADIPKQQLLELLEQNAPSHGGKNGSMGDSSLKKGAKKATSVSGSSTVTWEKDTTGATHLGSFRQQLDYLLTSRERSQLKKALQIYAEKRNIEHLVEDMVVILDTPSKRTLWFYIIPLLSDPHQDYCQRRLALPRHIKSGGKKMGHNGYHTSPRNAPIVTPRDGDVTFQNDDYFGQFAAALHGNFSGDEYGSSEDDGYPVTDIDRVHSRAVYSKHRLPHGSPAPSTFGTKDNRERARLRGLGEHALHRAAYDDSHVGINSTEGEISTVTMNPIYHEVGTGTTSSYPSSSGRRRVKLVRESSAQTTPLSSPVETRRPFDYKTIVHVYDDPHRRAEIIEVADSKSLCRDFTSQTPVQVSDVDDKNVDFHNIQHIKHSLPVVSSMTHTFQATQPELHSQHNGTNGIISDGESETSNFKTSVASYDSFNVRAMNAIKALDEVVASEPLDDNSIIGTSRIPKPPTPPPPPPPPPAPPLPGVGSGDGSEMNVKRINWEKLDAVDDNTLWAQMNDMEDLEDIVKYLELEQQFSTKRTRLFWPTGSPYFAAESFRDKKKEVFILSAKKAYNISILLGHLKMPVSDVKQSLYLMDEDILTPELLKQMLAYAPDSLERDQYNNYKGPLENLSKPDQFVYQISKVPGYEERLKAMLFKANFSEKVDELKEHLSYIRKASEELQHSKKLAKVLELVLVMGNHMNKGHARVGQAAGFRIAFLAQLDLTKTSDNKATFLHVLADAVYNKFPEYLNLKQDLTAVREAAKVSNVTISQDLTDLRRVLQGISTTVNTLSKQDENDRFHNIMEHFISHASDELQNLFSLSANSMQVFNSMVQYFGEDPKLITTCDIFGIFADFMTKFEKAHHHNIMYKRYQQREQQGVKGQVNPS